MSRYSSQRSSALVKAACTLVGSQKKLGAAAGYSQNAIFHAAKTGRVSAELAAGIEKATGGTISRHMLRPDLFGSALESSASQVLGGAWSGA